MNTESPVYFPPFHLDLANEQLWRESTAMPLRRKTFAVLRYLVEHPGQLLTKEQFLAAVWPGIYVSESMLTICIHELRHVLSDEARHPQLIETVHGRGYRFIGKVVSSQQSVVISPPPPTQHSVLSPQHSVLVGREAELTQLHHWLAKALHGERQIVFVSGEAGIGKTTLVEAFLFGVRSSGEYEVQNAKLRTPNTELPSTLVPQLGRGQCIEQHGAGEAFLPILDALGRLCRGSHGGELIDFLRRYAPMWLVQIPSLLGADEYEALQRQVQRATRERMLREMAEAVERLTAVQPLILVLEDLHWSDASTLDLLAFMARRNEPARLLVIGIYRPVEMLNEGHPLKDITQELYSHGLGAELPLGVLGEEAIAHYLQVRLGVGTGRAVLQRALARTLRLRTGGNPLFLVSVVNDLLAREVLVQTDTGWTLPEEANASESTVPDSIRHLVTRQSGRLSPVERHTLEAASVAGMEFSAAAVAAALATDTAAIEQRCEQLAERQQFLQRLGVEAWPDGTHAARYRFLHALYQQLWHERVSPTQLQRYHLYIGERKERAYGERAREVAAELAVHFEQGRDYRKAVQYLQYAGTNALQRSAHQEATNLFTKGLEILKTLPNTLERAQQELGMQLALGPALIAIKGNGALEVEKSYSRAQALCQQVGETRQLFPALFGLRSFHVVQAKLQTAHDFGKQLLTLAQKTYDTDFLLEAHLALGSTSMQLGEFASARAYHEQGLARYDPVRCYSHASLYGTDPGVLFCSCLSWILQWLGYPDQALKKDYEALSLAKTLSHPFSLAVTLNNSAVLYGHCREVQAMQQQAEALLALATAQGFPVYVAVGIILQGLALAEQGHKEGGIAQAHRGLAALRTARAEIPRPFCLTLLAETCGRIGQVEEGLEVLKEVQSIVDRTEARVHEAELYRLKGELTLQKEFQVSGSRFQVLPSPQHLEPSTHAEAEAEACFLKAIAIAQKQQAKSLELRATTSLARLWQQQRKTKQAHKMLVEIYNWFTEGFDTVDLKEAKTLIEELV